MCYIISRYGVTMRIFPRNHSFSTKNFPKRKSLEKDVREVTFSENFPSVLNQWSQIDKEKLTINGLQGSKIPVKSSLVATQINVSKRAYFALQTLILGIVITAWEKVFEMDSVEWNNSCRKLKLKDPYN